MYSICISLITRSFTNVYKRRINERIAIKAKNINGSLIPIKNTIVKNYCEKNYKKLNIRNILI